MNNLAIKTPDELLASPAGATPMMQQYLNVKKSHQDCLLFYRMGDFYELFFNDAIVAAEVLDIALTKRGKHQENEIPMCGVPHHSYEPYLQKLIKEGYRVAICEQMESPEEAKKRGYKAVVRREVVRIVTPGTLVEDNLLNAKEANYLAAIAIVNNNIALSWVDISTGQFLVADVSEKTLSADLARLSVKELLLPESLYGKSNLREMIRNSNAAITPHSDSLFDSAKTLNKLKDFYGVKSLDSFGNFSKQQISAAGALLEYIDVTQKGVGVRLEGLKVVDNKHFMAIDAATRKSLELTATMSGEKKGSLLSVIDKTITGSGSRLLSQILSAPLTDANAINNRLDMVEFFIKNQNLTKALQDILKSSPDFERALSRIYMQKASPKDLALIRDGLVSVNALKDVFRFHKEGVPKGIVQYLDNIADFSNISEVLQNALTDQPPHLLKEGGFIKAGFNQKLDEYRLLRSNSKEKLDELKEKYRLETDIANLKIVHNNVLGYFIEVTAQNSKKIKDEKFIHRQTLASVVRYTSAELQGLEAKINEANDSSFSLEIQLFNNLVEMVINVSDEIALAAKSVSGLDLFSSFSSLALDVSLTRPKIDDSLAFNIIKGRHIVVEKNLAGELENGFVSNNCDLSSKQRLWLLTGPNMAGKSTFLRQNALIAIMAQIGCYVPADAAHIGVVDRLFSRVGASDDLARGRSTFMVEMIETAAILNQSTARSLVILDEIGRGTATYDGLSIAWAVVEHIHNSNKSRALFATHYHELTSLTSSLASLSCHTMKVKDWNDEVIFLHEVIEGSADRSYGIHVAKIAGLPKQVIERSNQILKHLEQSKNSNTESIVTEGLPLFAEGVQESIVEEELLKINIDDLSPRDALDKLYSLKKLLQN